MSDLFTTRSNFAKVPRVFTYSAIVAALLGLFTPNPMLTGVGALLVPLLFKLLWRPGEPPVLLLGAGLQWMAVYLPVVNANFNGLPLADFFFIPTMDLAAWLGLMTILIIALGMRVGVGPWGLIDSRQLDHMAVQLNARRLMIAYLGAFILSFMIPTISAALPSAVQLILPLGKLRWIILFLILWAATRRLFPRSIAGLIVLGEIILGFGSYFSGFKGIFYFLLLAVMAGRSLRGRFFRPIVVFILVLVFSLGLVWQSIKSEYRTFLNQGTGMQVVLVSPESRAIFILNRVVNLTASDLSSGIQSTIDRMGYLDFLARSIGQVPEVIPYQKGRLLVEVAQHIFMPRLFFPDKPDINDSDRTNEFTGIRVAGAEQGASIGIGYAGESYIDFGPVLMFVPIFAFGWFWGWGYRFLVARSRFTMLSVSTAISFLIPSVTYFEQSNLKLVGGGITSLIVLTLILKFLGPRIWHFLTVGQALISEGNRWSERDGRMAADLTLGLAPTQAHRKRF